MSIVLLVGAGLLIRSLWQLQQVNPGFAAEQGAGDGSVAADRALRGRRADAVLSAARRARRARCPGVAAVGAINILPLSNNYDSRGMQVEDHPKPEGQGLSPQARSVTPGYFRAMGIPLLAGRNFDAHDVDERAARRDRQRGDGAKVLALG